MSRELVSGKSFVEAARRYEGSSCSDVNLCSGLIVLAMRDTCLLPANIDVIQSNSSDAKRLVSQWRFLIANSVEVSLRQGGLRSGDLLLSRWTDVDPRRNGAHHINIWTGWNNAPFGYQMQCLLPEHGGTGFVREVPLNALDWSRIERVYRLNAITGEES